MRWSQRKHCSLYTVNGIWTEPEAMSSCDGCPVETAVAGLAPGALVRAELDVCLPSGFRRAAGPGSWPVPSGWQLCLSLFTACQAHKQHSTFDRWKPLLAMYPPLWELGGGGDKFCLKAWEPFPPALACEGKSIRWCWGRASEADEGHPQGHCVHVSREQCAQATRHQQDSSLPPALSLSGIISFLKVFLIFASICK